MKRSLRTFTLIRDEDETGVSGTGTVAEGVQFTGGKCSMTWLSPMAVVSVYDSIHVVEDLHGHGGKTRVVWDEPAMTADDKEDLDKLAHLEAGGVDNWEGYEESMREFWEERRG